MSAPVPAYPVVYVDVAPDGSAHVNVAGRHEHLDSAPSDVTRRAVTEYATAVAAELHRPLRMQITDPDGKWLVAVHPNGTVTDLAEPAAKARRPRKQAVTVPATAAAPSPGTIGPPPITTPAPAVHRPPARPAQPIAPPPAPAHVDLEHTHLAQRPTPARAAAVPAATLQFSTGDVAHVTGAALIGRRPAADEGEDVDLLVNVDDESRMLSRTHLRIEWHDGALWATDRASSNGTTIERAGTATLELTPWQPLQLHDQDVAVLGDVRLTVSLVADDQEVNLE
ncbi:MAG TPA: FHA domain-containing protein [Rhodoglobus sp.]|nr:FHA domain-containing protein [Rhodoglobus sp.]